jgi:hypothetical protein
LFIIIGHSAHTNDISAGHWWLTPVILATQEAEIRRITGSKHAWANSSTRSYLEKPFTDIGLVKWLKKKKKREREWYLKWK